MPFRRGRNYVRFASLCSVVNLRGSAREQNSRNVILFELGQSGESGLYADDNGAGLSSVGCLLYFYLQVVLGYIIMKDVSCVHFGSNRNELPSFS